MFVLPSRCPDVRIKLNCACVCEWSVFWMISNVWLHFGSSPSLQMLLISSPLFANVPGECECVCCYRDKNSLSLVLIGYSDLSRLALRWLSPCLNQRNDSSDGYLNWNMKAWNNISSPLLIIVLIFLPSFADIPGECLMDTDLKYKWWNDTTINQLP